jgi:hypothetical protein
MLWLGRQCQNWTGLEDAQPLSVAYLLEGVGKTPTSTSVRSDLSCEGVVGETEFELLFPSTSAYHWNELSALIRRHRGVSPLSTLPYKNNRLFLFFPLILSILKIINHLVIVSYKAPELWKYNITHLYWCTTLHGQIHLPHKNTNR